MAIGSERKNRRVPYEPKGRSSAASAAKSAAGGKNVRKKGNVKKAAEPKQSDMLPGQMTIFDMWGGADES